PSGDCPVGAGHLLPRVFPQPLDPDHHGREQHRRRLADPDVPQLAAASGRYDYSRCTYGGAGARGGQAHGMTTVGGPWLLLTDHAQRLTREIPCVTAHLLRAARPTRT